MSLLTGGQKALFFIAISTATFMMILDYSIANVSIPYIAGDLAVSTDEGTYVITSFAVGNAIGLAMTGWLAKRMGEIKLMCISITLFTLFSWICGLSINLQMIVINRFIQGLVSGPMVPLSQSLLIRFSTPEKRSRDLSIWATIVITAPVVGPVLGGYISDWYSWPWIFYINIPFGIFCVASIWLIGRHHESKIEKVKNDIPGMLLLALGVSCLQIFLDKGQQWDWMNSERIILLVIGTIIFFTYLIIRELWYKPPFLDLALFSSPSFCLSILCLLFSYAMYFGSVVLIPLWLQEYMTYNAEWAGISVSTLGIAPLFLTMLTPHLLKKFGSIKTLILSFFFFAFGSFYTSLYTFQVDILHLALGRFFFGFGFVSYITPLLIISIEGLPSSRIPGATGIFHFVRSMMGAVGTAVFTTIWQRRTIFHHERLAEVMTPFNPLLPPLPDQASLNLLNISLDQQAAMLAINECFWLMGWLFIGLILLLIAYQFFRQKTVVTVTPTNISVE